jgi:3-oxoacyl-[acyl-carrier-protein] synthase III
MTQINLSNTVFTKAKFRYSISEIVDDFLKKKLDKDVREHVKNNLGIDYIYKSYDFSKIDFDKGDFIESDVSLNEMYYKTAKKSLRGVDPKKIGLFITINDNQQYLDPSPTVELIPKLSLSNDIRTQNFQGLACSSFSESLLNSAGYFLMDGKKDALVLIGTNYTPWFLDKIKQIKHISKKDKSNFYNLIYFLIFSDAVASTILSRKKKKDTQIQINSKSILTLKNTKNGGKNAMIKMTPNKKHRITFDMKLDPKKLREEVTNLSIQNINTLQKKMPSEFKKIKILGIHTAGSRFVDGILEKCQLDKTLAKLSYDLMRKTGNTGAVSSLQFLNECINKKTILKNNLGCFVDYGWEGTNLFVFRKLN